MQYGDIDITVLGERLKWRQLDGLPAVLGLDKEEAVFDPGAIVAEDVGVGAERRQAVHLAQRLPHVAATAGHLPPRLLHRVHPPVHLGADFVDLTVAACRSVRVGIIMSRRQNGRETTDRCQ